MGTPVEPLVYIKVKREEGLGGLGCDFKVFKVLKVLKVFRQQDVALVLVHYREQGFIGNQQARLGVLHHEVQSLLRVTWVERLESTAGFQHAEGCYRHPFASGNQYRNHILQAQALAGNIACYAVAECVHLGIGVAILAERHGNLVGHALRLTPEQRDDGLTVVIRFVRFVEAVQQLRLLRIDKGYVAQIFLGKEALHHDLIALQKLPHECLGILQGVVFRLDAALAVAHVCLNVDGHVACVVHQEECRHRLAVEGGIVEHLPMPGECRCRLQAEVVHEVAVGVCLVLTATCHLLLPGLEELEHRGVACELSIGGQRLDKHADGVLQESILPAVVDVCEKGFLFVVVLCEQECENRGEQGALEDAVCPTECVDALHACAKRPCKACLRVELWNDGLTCVHIRYERRVGVTAIEVLGKPCFRFVERRRLSHDGFRFCRFRHSHAFLFQFEPLVSRFYVV